MGRIKLSSILSVVWKSVLTGMIYLVLCMIAGMALMALGLKLPASSGDMGQLTFNFLITGTLLAAFLGPVSMKLQFPIIKRILFVLSVLFFNSASVVIEAAYFVNGIISTDTLPSVILQQFIISLGTALMIGLLFKSKEIIKSNIKIIIKWHQWAWRLLAGIMSYVVFYYIFGTINFYLFTGTYYEASMGGLSIPSAIDVIKIEPIRALIMVISILPLALYAPYSKKRKMVMSGLVLFFVGGIVPLVSQINTLPFLVLFASMFEIFLQNFLTGLVTALVFNTTNKNSFEVKPMPEILGK